MKNHTSTPWKVGDRKPYVEIWGPMRMNSSPILASMEHEPREANAAFIVRAVNSYDQLVDALQKIADLVDSEAGEPLDDAIRIANEALSVTSTERETL